MKLIGTLGLAAVLVTLLACTSSSETSSGDPGVDAASDASSDAAAECSTGPTYDRGFQDYHKSYDPKQYGSCTPHCGYTGGTLGGFVYADALPSGACTGVGSPCSMILGVTCCGEMTRGGTGINHKMRCDCIDGNWKCIIATQGGGACDCSNQDASAGD